MGNSFIYYTTETGESKTVVEKMRKFYKLVTFLRAIKGRRICSNRHCRRPVGLTKGIESAITNRSIASGKGRGHNPAPAKLDTHNAINEKMKIWLKYIDITQICDIVIVSKFDEKHYRNGGG